MKNKWKIKNPAIKVLGLNPHAGDGGFIGLEDQEILIPVIENLNSLGLDITGPLSADTAFIDKDNQTKEDVILAMYHDQGLPVIKTLGFGSIVVKAANASKALPVNKEPIVQLAAAAPVPKKFLYQLLFFLFKSFTI